MFLTRYCGSSIALLLLATPAISQEWAWGESDGEQGGKYAGIPFYWIFNVYPDFAQATGVATVSGFGSNSMANTVFEITRNGAASRQSKTYRTYIDVNYFAEAPPPRSLRSKIEIGGSAREFSELVDLYSRDFR